MLLERSGRATITVPSDQRPLTASSCAVDSNRLASMTNKFVSIVFGREGRLGTRTIRITAMGENRTRDTVSTVSRVSDHGDRAGLNHPRPGLEPAL